MQYDDLKAKYPEFIAGLKRLPLNRNNVPPELHAYIPYAEVWGVPDDLEREQLAERAPEAAKAEVARIVKEIDDQLDEWLAGPEAESENPSDEYVAFSAMRMAVDFM